MAFCRSGMALHLHPYKVIIHQLLIEIQNYLLSYPTLLELLALSPFGNTPKTQQ